MKRFISDDTADVLLAYLGLERDDEVAGEIVGRIEKALETYKRSRALQESPSTARQRPSTVKNRLQKLDNMLKKFLPRIQGEMDGLELSDRVEIGARELVAHIEDASSRIKSVLGQIPKDKTGRKSPDKEDLDDFVFRLALIYQDVTGSRPTHTRVKDEVKITKGYGAIFTSDFDGLVFKALECLKDQYQAEAKRLSRTPKKRPGQYQVEKAIKRAITELKDAEKTANSQ